MEGLEHMGYFDTETVVLPLPSDPRNAGAEPASDGSRPPGYWVEIKDQLDFGDINFRNKRIVRLSSKGLAGALADADAAWEIDQFSQATLERAILEWNLTRRDGTREIPIKVTPATIATLKQRDATFILAEVMRRNRAEDAQDETGKVGDSEPTSSVSMDEPAPTPKQPDSAT